MFYPLSGGRLSYLSVNGYIGMKVLIFDTESTGLPVEEKDPFHYPEYWPRLVQLAWILADDEQILEEQSYIISPEGFTIPRSAIEVHGITNERAKEEGRSLQDVLAIFSEALGKAEIIVGHNVSFDRSVVTAEFARTKQNAPILGLPYHCTMKSTADVCKIPSKMRGKGFKWPSLNELYSHLFEEPFEDAHNALADVRACSRCYFELKKQGLFQELRSKPDVKEGKYKKRFGNPRY
jgi:DNA polymerase III subunit epsilon